MKKITVCIILSLFLMLFCGCTNNTQNTTFIIPNFVINDAEENSTLIGDPNIFNVGEPIIKLSHYNGSSIDWRNMKVYVRPNNCDYQILMHIISINGDVNISKLSPPYTSKDGDIVKFGVEGVSDEILITTDIIEVSIYHNDKLIYQNILGVMII